MKKSSLIYKLTAGTLAVACILPTITACSGCEHTDVGGWQTVTASTCTAEGVEKGICADCMEEITRALPVNPDAHAYGEWTITVPTETATGLAKKTCSINENHTLTAILPVLSSDKYTSSITKRPSALGDGERTFSYEHLAGNISFTSPISANGIQTVRDAVEVITAQESHDLIRSASGMIGYEYHSPEITWQDDAGVTQKFESNNQVYHHDYSYEFGDNYTHINGGTYDNTERWYGVDTNGVYGFAQTSVYNQDGSVKNKEFFYETGRNVLDAEKYINGFRFVLMYETDLGAFYGAEELLAGLYRAARLSTNEDFTQKISQTIDGETLYSFSFGHYNREADGLFGNVTVSFTMTGEYTVKTLSAKSTVYVNNTDMDITSQGQFNTWKLTTVNGKTVARIIEGRENGPHYVDLISVTQKTKAETASEPVPENPYQREKGVVYDSFDVVVGDEVLPVEHTAISTNAYRDGTGEVKFTIKNIKPDSAVSLGVDGFNLYYRDSAGNDHPIAYDTLSSVGMNFSKTGNAYTVRSQIAGENLLVIKTAATERVIKLNVARIAPTAVYPTIYKYSSIGYSENKQAEGAAKATVYVGQKLYFRAVPPELEVNYVDASVTATVTSGDALACTIENSVDHASLPFTVKEGVAVSSFVASTAGTYTITLASTKLSTAKCTVVVTVEEAPTIENILSNTYFANLEYPVKGRAKITFATVGGNVRANVEYNGRTTVLNCIYDAATKTLASEIVEGGGLLEDTEYNFALSMNEAYDLVLSHPMGTAYENMPEQVVAWRDISSVLSGSYTASLTTPAAGTATVTFATDVDGDITATVAFNGQTVTLECSYEITTKTLTTTVVGEVEGEYNFSLRLNGAFSLILSHPNGAEGVEEVALIKV